jgi:hypothetical protein
MKLHMAEATSKEGRTRIMQQNGKLDSCQMLEAMNAEEECLLLVVGLQSSI